MIRGSANAIAGASFRYQRILVPALAWMLALLITVARMAIRRRWSGNAAAIYALALAVAFLRNRGVSEDAYNFGRVLSPLLLLAFFEYFSARSVRHLFAALAPMALIDLRTCLA